MNSDVVIGVDPGGTTGICVVTAYTGQTGRIEYKCETVQCSGETTPLILTALVGYFRPRRIATERFVVGPRASRVSSSGASKLARELVGVIERAYPHACVLRSASDAKTWGTDERLDAAGHLAPTKTARHARDAARHALFSMHRDLHHLDPLSRRTARPRRGELVNLDD